MRFPTDAWFVSAEILVGGHLFGSTTPIALPEKEANHREQPMKQKIDMFFVHDWSLIDLCVADHEVVAISVNSFAQPGWSSLKIPALLPQYLRIPISPLLAGWMLESQTSDGFQNRLIAHWDSSRDLGS
jgi:hypothetical protein